MNNATKKTDSVPVKKKKGMSPFRMVTTILSIAVILWLTSVVYEKFGIGDAQAWFNDVLTLVLVLFLVFLAAVVVVGLLMLVRKIRN